MQLRNHLPEEIKNHSEDRFLFYDKILSQKRGDKKKIYSLHEPDVYCMSKSKVHKQYEFGCKVSIGVTAYTGIIVSATSFETNVSDVHTLAQTLEQLNHYGLKVHRFEEQAGSLPGNSYSMMKLPALLSDGLR